MEGEEFLRSGEVASRENNWAGEISEEFLKPWSSWDFTCILPLLPNPFPTETSLRTDMDTASCVLSLKPAGPVLFGLYTPNAKEGIEGLIFFMLPDQNPSPSEGLSVCGEAVSPPPHYDPINCSLVAAWGPRNTSHPNTMTRCAHIWCQNDLSCQTIKPYWNA